MGLRLHCRRRQPNCMGAFGRRGHEEPVGEDGGEGRGEDAKCEPASRQEEEKVILGELHMA